MAISKRKLVIDGQVFQTDAKDRGMGRYSICLIIALLQQSAYDQVEILLTRNLHISAQDEQALKKLFPGTTLYYLNLKTTVKIPIEEAFSHNKAILDRYFSKESKNTKVDYLIPSPFQEPVVSVFPDNVKKLIIFYDLIPYLYYQRYQPLMQYENYLKRFRFIFEADCIFTISQTVADDLHTYIGIPKKRMVRIDGAPIRTDHTTTKPSHFDIPDSFILMPTSDDPRKNNLRAVLGFEEFYSIHSPKNHKLIITSKIHKREREQLSLFSNNLIFTGNLDESELNWLYEACEAVLFVPESEGLGLPVLEAVEANKKIVCSSLPVFKEISETAFYFCDHENQSSIASALEDALYGGKNIPAKEYQRILSYYNWTATANRFSSGNLTVKTATEAMNKPRIAMFTPIPDGLSAIGKVVSESHAVMSEYFDIDYYAERGLYAKSVRPNYLQYVANYYYAETFSVEKYGQYNAVVYHIGNGDYHLESIKNGLYLPGYAIIHDTNIKEAYRVLKETGMMHESRVRLEELLDSKVEDDNSHFLVSLSNSQLGILTHSNFAHKAVKQIVPNETPTKVVNLPTNVATLPNYKEHKNIVIGLAGIIADVKGIEVIEAIANDVEFKDCSIKLFGFSGVKQETLDRLNSYENVTAITNLSDFDFQVSISKLDVFVNYRLSYNGETSLSTIEAMRQGVAVFVRKIGWYDELPDDSVVKVQSADEVLQQLKQLIKTPDQLSKIGERARQFIAENFSHEQYARGLLELLKQEQPDTPNRSMAIELKAKRIRTSKQYLDAFTKRRKLNK